MDLYIQVGVLLVMASMFALVVYFYSDSTARGLEIAKALDKPTVNYSLDSSVTTPTFFVDSRVFTQWAINAHGQRKVYLIYPNSIEPSASLYGQYLHKLTVRQSNTDLADRSLTVHPQVPSEVPNAYYVNDQSPKTVDYLSLYQEEAKLKGRDKMVTVYTFTDDLSGEVIYVCYIK